MLNIYYIIYNYISESYRNTNFNKHAVTKFKKTRLRDSVTA